MSEPFNAQRAAAGLKKRRSKVSEKQVESDGKKRVSDAGGFSAKFKSPGHRARPDQIEFYGIEPMIELIWSLWGVQINRQEATALLASAIQLTEYKRPGEKPTEAQHREHAKFRALGFTVNVINQRTDK